MAVADGWIPPTELSEEEYKALRHSPSSPIKGFAKYGCSFGGKPWGGYARNAKGQNYAGGSSRSLVKQSTGLDNVLFKCCDYASWDDLEGTVVYCDPPYIGTTGYGKLFDHQRFWKVMDSWVDQGAIVFVSEMQAPNHWSPILTINRKRKVEAMSGSIQEFLFTRNGL